MKKPQQLNKLIISLVVCFSISGSGAVLTTTDSINNWYAQLQKPTFTPPDWVFGPVWTILYFLMAISAYLVWKKGLDYPKAKQALGWFLIQLVLNAIWTPIFFGLRQPLAAFVDIVLLCLAIALTIISFYKVYVPAAILLVPYIVWVSFAAILNAAICILN